MHADRSNPIEKQKGRNQIDQSCTREMERRRMRESNPMLKAQFFSLINLHITQPKNHRRSKPTEKPGIAVSIFANDYHTYLPSKNYEKACPLQAFKLILHQKTTTVQNLSTNLIPTKQITSTPPPYMQPPQVKSIGTEPPHQPLKPESHQLAPCEVRWFEQIGTQKMR